MKLLKLFFICTAAAFFGACSNITEEITIKTDGTGEYMVYSDIIPGMRDMSIKMVEMFSKMDTTQTLNMDSLKQAVEIKIWEDFPGEIDSVMDFSTQIPDSIKNDPKKQKYLSKMEGFMRGGQSKGYLNTGVAYQFDNLKGLNEFFEFIEENQSVGNKQGGAFSAMSGMDTEVTYTLKGKKLSRVTKVLKKPEMDEKTLAAITLMMPENAVYKTVIHLPSKVKKASGKSLVKAEGKTVVFEYRLSDILTGEYDTDFEIQMK